MPQSRRGKFKRKFLYENVEHIFYPKNFNKRRWMLQIYEISLYFHLNQFFTIFHKKRKFENIYKIIKKKMLLFSILYISLLFFKQPFIILAVERIENSSFESISNSVSTPNVTIPFKQNIINHLIQKPFKIELLPVPELLLGSKSSDSSSLPVFPERPDAVYFIVAVVGGAKTWGRTLARTLLDMGQPFESPQGPPLRPLYVDLPQNGR